ncbi:MAG: hypothetical protein HPY81_06435 [Firmicutes bacterium]|nr:hypothetical protein [Bacillota bacterium]
MKLNANERSILAYFPSDTAANEVANTLKNMGIETVQVDWVSRYGVVNDTEYNSPITGQTNTLTGLALYSADTDLRANQDARILLGADPSVSGMSARSYGQAGGRAFMVTVVTTEDRLPEVIRVMRENGGFF